MHVQSLKALISSFSIELLRLGRDDFLNLSYETVLTTWVSIRNVNIHLFGQNELI